MAMTSASVRGAAWLVVALGLATAAFGAYRGSPAHAVTPATAAAAVASTASAATTQTPQPSAAAAQAQGAGVPTAGADPLAVRRWAQHAREAGNYELLEKAMDQALKERSRTSIGDLIIPNLVRGAANCRRDCFGNDISQMTANIKELEQWHAKTKSAHSALVLATARINRGLATRQGAPTNMASPAFLAELGKDIELGRQLLNNFEAALKDNPEAYTLQMYLALMTGASDAELDALEKRGVAEFNYDSDSIYMTAFRYSPEWGGSSKAMGDFFDRVTAGISDTQLRELIYANIFVRMSSSEAFSSGIGDWKRVRTELERIVGESTHPYAAFEAAYLACQAGDNSSARKFVGAVDAASFDAVRAEHPEKPGCGPLPWESIVNSPILPAAPLEFRVMEVSPYALKSPDYPAAIEALNLSGIEAHCQDVQRFVWPLVSQVVGFSDKASDPGVANATKKLERDLHCDLIRSCMWENLGMEAKSYDKILDFLRSPAGKALVAKMMEEEVLVDREQAKKVLSAAQTQGLSLGRVASAFSGTNIDSLRIWIARLANSLDRGMASALTDAMRSGGIFDENRRFFRPEFVFEASAMGLDPDVIAETAKFAKTHEGMEFFISRATCTNSALENVIKEITHELEKAQ